jgi:hypothetical protein
MTAAGVHLLDADPQQPKIVTLDPSTLEAVRVRGLKPPKRSIEPFGLVVDGEGGVVVLAAGGARLVRYSSTASEPSEELLSEPCTGIWSVGGRILLNPIQIRGGEFLLAEWTGRALRRFGTLSARDAVSRERAIITNMVSCGPEAAGEVPCWHIAEGTEVLFHRPDGRIRRVRVPGRALRSDASPGDGKPNPFDSFTYPVRDVFPISGSLFWMLTNQEGAVVPGKPGAVRSRHALLIDTTGTVRKTVPLPKEARMILAGTDRDVVVLFKDLTIGRHPR